MEPSFIPAPGRTWLYGKKLITSDKEGSQHFPGIFSSRDGTECFNVVVPGNPHNDLWWSSLHVGGSRGVERVSTSPGRELIGWRSESLNSKVPGSNVCAPGCF